MRRGLIILLAGLLVAVAASCGYYMLRVHEPKAMLQGSSPELAWLKEEFALSDAEFERVSQLHEGYMPQCAEMCDRIASKNKELKELLGQAEGVTPEIEQTLEEANALRTECHKNMLRHFFEVSRAMPPAQGKRYLQWVQERTILSDAGMMAEGHQTHE